MKLLFIPGAGGGKEEWVYQTRYFAGSEAIAFPGHPEGEPFSSIEDSMEWLQGHIHRHRYQDIILAGHSLGGAIAQLCGLNYGGEVKALILIGTGARLRIHPSFLEALRGMIFDEVVWRKFLGDMYSLVSSEIRQLVIEARMRIGPAVMLDDLLCCNKFDVMDRVHAIKIPTLVICGREDALTPVKYSHYLTDNIEGARQVIINGAGHLVFLEKPEEVNQAIEEFLAHLN